MTRDELRKSIDIALNDLDNQIIETNVQIKKYRAFVNDEECRYMLPVNKKILDRELKFRASLYNQRAKMLRCAASLQARVEELA